MGFKIERLQGLSRQELLALVLRFGRLKAEQAGPNLGVSGRLVGYQRVLTPKKMEVTLKVIFGLG